MDADTFSDNEVISYSNLNFISMKINAESDKGKKLAQKFNITGFPTILFLNDDRDEIDRIIGYTDSEKFLLELKRIQSGKNTLPFLKTAIIKEPDKVSLLYVLAKKYQDMNDIESSKKIIYQIIDKGIDSLKNAEYMSVLFKAKEDKNPNILIDFANKFPKNINSYSAIQEAMYLVRGDGSNKKLEANLFLKLINLKTNNPPSMLNNFSWRMSELELYMDIALEKIILAIKRSTDEESKHMYIDTKAEILWKMGRIEEALVEIRKCRLYKPNDK